uniref:MSP domain-containing protein n=1 Tax=Oryza punctata TaxID=4537 RepID=A0A0E0MEN5_ORYPU
MASGPRDDGTAKVIMSPSSGRMMAPLVPKTGGSSLRIVDCGIGGRSHGSPPQDPFRTSASALDTRDEERVKAWHRRLRAMTSSESKDLRVDPAFELRFPFEVNRDMSYCLQLINQTDGYIAFSIKTNQNKYRTQPDKGTMPPWSKRYITVTMKSQEKAPPNMQCHDMFLVQSTMVSEDIAPDSITDELFRKMAGKVVDVEKLPIVYVPLPQPEKASC